MKLLYLLSLFLIFFSCKKKTETKFSTYELRLIDSPGMYQNLFIDITSVEVMIQGIGWKTMNNKFSGLIDLLEYNNGVDLLLADKYLEQGKIIKVRILFGENNFIVKNGIYHTLILSANVQNGLIIDMDSDLKDLDMLEEWIDIDVGKSIIENNDGTFIFNPSVRTFKNQFNGRIKGYVFPIESQPYIQAIKGNDTLTAIPDSSGFYQFSGLQGSYKLKFIPSLMGYSTVITNPINVTSNQIQVYDTINL